MENNKIIKLQTYLCLFITDSTLNHNNQSHSIMIENLSKNQFNGTSMIVICLKGSVKNCFKLNSRCLKTIGENKLLRFLKLKHG